MGTSAASILSRHGAATTAPGSYHTLEHPSCSHPIATGGNPANPIDPPTDPVSTLQGSLHVNPITPVATQQVVPDNRDRHVVPIAPTPNHRQPLMISMRQLRDLL